MLRWEVQDCPFDDRRMIILTGVQRPSIWDGDDDRPAPCSSVSLYGLLANLLLRLKRGLDGDLLTKAIFPTEHGRIGGTVERKFGTIGAVGRRVRHCFLKTGVLARGTGPDASEGYDAGDRGHDEIFWQQKPADLAELHDCEDHCDIISHKLASEVVRMLPFDLLGISIDSIPVMKSIDMASCLSTGIPILQRL